MGGKFVAPAIFKLIYCTHQPQVTLLDQIAVTLELSERLVEMAPKPMSKVLYANSGSESNDTAVKVA